MGYTPPHLEVRKITGGWSMFPPTLTTGDDLTIYPNGTDTTPSIKLNGDSYFDLITKVGGYLRFFNTTTEVLNFQYATPDLIIYCPINDKNIFLKTLGTGTVKFGTYTAGAATDSTGYITITDAGGTARKLMVQA